MLKFTALDPKMSAAEMQSLAIAYTFLTIGCRDLRIDGEPNLCPRIKRKRTSTETTIKFPTKATVWFMHATLKYMWRVDNGKHGIKAECDCICGYWPK